MTSKLDRTTTHRTHHAEHARGSASEPVQQGLKMAPAFSVTPKTGFETPAKSGKNVVSGTTAKNTLSIPWPGHGCADKIGWIQDVQPPTHDSTAEFQKLDEAAKAGKSILPPDANKYVYVAVGGLFSGAAPKELYFDQNLDALKAAGCKVARAPVDTDMGVEYNAKIVRDTIMKYAAQGKQVVLIGHSKGGLDSEAALALYPETRDHVRALVTIQSPYGGSPIADDLLEHPELKAVLSAGVEALGGDPACGIDLTYEARQKFLAKHPMPPGIPTVCMASNRCSPFSPLFTTAEYMKDRYHIPSDGLVSPKDAFIPGSRTVTLQGVDHLDSTVSELNPFLPYHPKDLTLSLVAMALEQPKA